MEEKDRRSLMRTDLVYYLEIRDKSQNKMIGRLGDISDGGLMILSEEPLELNSLYSITIKLPRGHNFSKQEIEIAVMTRWVKSDFNPKFICTGCEFSIVRDTDVGIINMLIKGFSFKDTAR
jgi:hypothetical protein